jgi:SAM-dependent methyltransferase
MAHPSQLDFVARVKARFPERFAGRRVLEVGSLDINGSVRSFFEHCDYVGIDVAAGPGVDLVCQGQDYDGPDDAFDTVISCEVMEHNPHWADTLRNMVRVCRPGGLIVMTCATLGRKEHGTARTTPGASPLTVGLGWNYYRNLTARDFRRARATQGATCVFGSDWTSYDLYMVGIKGAAAAGELEKLLAIRDEYRAAHRSSWKSIRRAAKALLRNRRN